MWTASNYDLNTIVLRKDWGFTGIVMTDWWAAGSDENQPSSVENRAGMVEAQNDMYMVTSDCTDLAQDNVKEALENGRVTRGMLQRNARNILGFILQSPAMLYEMDMISGEEIADAKSGDEDEIDYSNVRYYKPDENGDVIIPGEGWNTNQGQSVVDVTPLGLGKTIKVGELKYEGLELLNAKEAVVCAVKLTRAARGAQAAAGK